MISLACVDKLKIAWKEYKVAKKEAWALKKSFLEDKIARKAHNWDMATKYMAKMMKHE